MGQPSQEVEEEEEEEEKAEQDKADEPDEEKAEDEAEEEAAEEEAAEEKDDEPEMLGPPTPEALKEKEEAEKAAKKAAEKKKKDAEKAAEKKRKKEEEKRKKEEEKEKEAAEAKAIEEEMKTLQRNVTLGDWAAIKEYFATLEKREAKAGFTQMLKSLQKGPKQKPTVPSQGRQYIEVNRFSPADVLGLANLYPLELEKDHLTKLGQILAQALQAGHQIEAFLNMVSPHLEEEGYAFTRRELARLLVNASQPLFMGDYLPTTEKAIEDNDREGLNLLSRYLLAQYAKEAKTTWLEKAWDVTQAVLAAGEVEEEEKKEAITRAVDIAPKIKEELGQKWLNESFTNRPERGMEIVAAVGSTTSKALSHQPMDADKRFKLLELQTTATNSLLDAAPELGTEWSAELALLADNWLREAIHTYTHDTSTSRGPNMQRDLYGNFYYYNYGSRSNNNIPKPITTGEILEIKPGDKWLSRIDPTLLPRIHMIYAQLLLKVSDEAEAFPHIEMVAQDYPRQAKDLVDEFLRVWAKNHDPNSNNNRRNPYIYFYGFERRANGIPLTRSKQERNLRELGDWVSRLRELEVEVDESLVANAFTTAHSTAEIYRLETIEQIFGPLGDLEPATLAELVQRMRANLLEVWRDPATQKDNKTNRRQKDIQAEVLRGYDLAHSTLAKALADHPSAWELWLAQACIDHDKNNFMNEISEDSEFSSRREAALGVFATAADHYAAKVDTLEKDDETTKVYEHWFYAALGSTDLSAVESKMTLSARQIPLIRQAVLDLPGERAERHMEKLASTLFSRMSNASPGVKYRYVREGLEIVGDHELAREARDVYDYYKDLVTEIQLVASIDGSDRVGHTQPFGLRIDIRHTKEIERESGGFSKYLQNQNQNNFGWNYGRPLEDYRDKFEEATREKLGEHFEVLSVTFNDPKARSRAEPEYGWRVTPYAYVLMKPKGAQIDRIPSLHLDLDFLDTTGYAVLPVETSAVPLDASDDLGDERPYEELTLVQTLDERQAKDGKLLLEVKASAYGLLPELDQLLDLQPEGFDVEGADDGGVSIVEFNEDGRSVKAERIWTVSMRAREDLEALPTTFTFGKPLVDTESQEQFRYVDADLAAVEPVISLEERYGETKSAWLMWVPALLALFIVAFFSLRYLKRPRVVEEKGFRIPDPLTPFTVLGLLRDIQSNNGLAADERQNLGREIDALEHHFFIDEDTEKPDLQRIAESWAGRARV